MTYIIRIQHQDISGPIVWENGVGSCPNAMTKDELFADLMANGLEIIKHAYSTYGSCFFIEVKGNYTGSIPFSKVKTTADEFMWNV